MLSGDYRNTMLTKISPRVFEVLSSLSTTKPTAIKRMLSEEKNSLKADPDIVFLKSNFDTTLKNIHKYAKSAPR